MEEGRIKLITLEVDSTGAVIAMVLLSGAWVMTGAVIAMASLF
jgi:hypothetical protein